MTSDLAIYRAGVKAGATAEAIERFTQIRVGKEPRPPIVNDDQVEFFRAVLIIRATGASNCGDIAGDSLARSGADEKAQHNAHVFN